MFSEMVQVLVDELKCRRPPVIAAELIQRLYPKTREAAEAEDAIKYFQDGVALGVRAVIKREPAPEQGDLRKLFPSLFPYITKLKRPSYYVPLLDDFATIQELIEAPSMLDDARQYLRKQGSDTLEQASALDDLFHAVERQRHRKREAAE